METFVIIVRAFIGFFTLLIYARILGKKQISQLSVFDYITGITIGSLTSNMIVNLDSRAWNHWLGLSVVIILTLMMQYITIKFQFLNKVIVGEPTLVIHKGQILEKNMRQMRFTLSDLTERLRQKNIFNLADVEFAILETGGTLSVQKKSQHRPLTPLDLGLRTEHQGMPTAVIQEGAMIEHNMQRLNLDANWLLKELKDQYGVEHIKEVFYAEVNPAGKLYADTYKDKFKQFLDPSDFKGPF
ncbi:DUF421 domain-containing protein [Desulforamulus ruminis]|uniref:DUF421 domain-containing protein n=1 Tax=Desulforamulus ruminis (strain ATCC 23193 / DSM 2154 / NCIMB 8452 / DL) TaxID=696281 RepID=F6DUX2_DESRL|nr:DUF421 domain-containing protein [Desulforamulus ruminis]AEG61369.1 protein of unknown function DUF421 [Desulforamulus ruminis DSM 2154]